MKFITTSDIFIKRGYKWVAFDSMTIIADYLKDYLIKKNFTGFDFWNEYLLQMKYILSTQRDTTRFNCLSIYEICEKENSSGLLEKKFGLEGSIRDRVPYFYDIVLASKKMIKDKKPQYVLQTVCKDGYNYLGGRNVDKLNEYEPSNIDHIIKKVLS